MNDGDPNKYVISRLVLRRSDGTVLKVRLAAPASGEGQ